MSSQLLLARGSGRGQSREGISYAMTAIRFAADTGDTIISAGVPLKPGLLHPDDLNTVRLYRNGVEQSVYVEEIPRRHLDGTVRSVLIQCDAGTMSNMVEDTTWELLINQGKRKVSDRTKNTSAVQFATAPAGFLYYTHPQDRINSWLLLGPTTTIAASPAREPFLKYNSTNAFTGGAGYSGIKGALDAIWNSHIPDPTIELDWRDQYFNGDPAWPNLHYWVRGGGPQYLYRVFAYTNAYVTLQTPDVLLPNNQGVERFSDLHGGNEWRKWYRSPRSYYWLTGDERAKTFMKTCADQIWAFHNNAGYFNAGVAYAIDPRAYAQNGGLNLSSWLVGQADTYFNRSKTIWNKFIELGNRGPTIGVHYYVDGAATEVCRGQKAYMQGLMHAFMIEYVENAEPAKRSELLAQLALELPYLWDSGDYTKAYVRTPPQEPGFSYFWSPEMDAAWRLGDATCNTQYISNSEQPGRARVRDGYNIESFAYYAYHTGDTTSMTRAEEVFRRHIVSLSGWNSLEGFQGFYNNWSIFGYGVT